MGFIGYLVEGGNGPSGQTGKVDDVMRIFLECQEEPAKLPAAAVDAGQATGVVSYTYAVEVIFPRGLAPCRLRGVEDVLALKKFYKLVHSLEERAREHGNPREKPLDSKDGMVEHLGFTRNARDLSGAQLVSRRGTLAGGSSAEVTVSA